MLSLMYWADLQLAPSGLIWPSWWTWICPALSKNHNGASYGLHSALIMHANIHEESEPQAPLHRFQCDYHMLSGNSPKQRDLEFEVENCILIIVWCLLITVWFQHFQRYSVISLQSHLLLCIVFPAAWCNRAAGNIT